MNDALRVNYWRVPLSLCYHHFCRGGGLDGDAKIAQWKKQVEGFMPIISGARMEEDYLNFAFLQKISTPASGKASA
ncbi:MAG: hypothetical protein A2845_01630 [Candidatus Lloydbacteria bacterium RIFCSPHIGHO2_01_FULL_49_22]|uniref:Uncharacterized protein n=1 Tax=Candidatus Lloydbacteria bacterium RIFCSPHIGHO2_01_FULL_49_22 TaxID=1798658 RepID=A0A1G2CXV8_9BACT|nr:MAG: hypothetical protein A2845_01630 [Candidatus Lloydbacteria bacterium RIFCSPHIGHO2_01_FULL_49_22]OGZ09998.1 MAG: hypothetical protein A3C14_04795 [Candidatus Lloydbacteria bacterium RIFCSPHIGHO2_02_FULL_50_18]